MDFVIRCGQYAPLNFIGEKHLFDIFELDDWHG